MGTKTRDLMEREEKQQDELADEEEEPLHPRCRICAKSVPRRIAACIFGRDGQKRNLQENILKYLYITVSSEDELPKTVCTSCVKKLDDIHTFATMALKSQEKLRQQFLETSLNSATTADSSDSFDSTENKLGERGLLHSILTKGSTETLDDEEELLAGRRRTPSTEEMEVKVDPMLFLQCAFEQTSSPEDYSNYSDASDEEIECHTNPEPLPLRKKNIDGNGRNYSTVLTTNKNTDLNERKESNDVHGNKNINECDEEDVANGEESKLKQYFCKICAKTFVSQLALQNHLWSHLPVTSSTNEIRSYLEKNPDSHLQMSFDTSNGMITQNAENTLLTNTFLCPICGKKISTKGNLKVHLETHRPKGKYGCDICGRIFKTQSNLFRHKEYHSGIQFPCSVCGRVYPTNSTLRAHSITHSDLRPHACPLCDKTFKRNQDLKFHINQHTGARPYQCPYCPKAFASSGNCFSHRKRMHPKEVHRDRQRAADLMR